ncbi:MAG: polyphosphate polymerase domain-containing protein [Bacteroidota bacterium]
MRRELKYLVREADRERLLSRIGPFVTPDPYARPRADGRTGYTVRSIYFDTPGLRDWAEKESGDQVRRKLRVRGYDAPGSSPLVLEIKRKEEQAVWKDRATVTARQAVALLSRGPLPCLPEPARTAAKRFVYRLRAERRQPTLLVTYWREPLVGRFDPSLRVTLDQRLRVASFPRLGPDADGLYRETLRPVLRGRFILEVKFDRVYPSWLRETISRLGLSRQALSKYAIGMEAEARAAPWRFGRPAITALADRPALVV